MIYVRHGTTNSSCEHKGPEARSTEWLPSILSEQYVIVGLTVVYVEREVVHVVVHHGRYNNNK